MSNMSKQLATSSAFASFAMAAMVLTYTPSGFDRSKGDLGEFGLQAGQLLPDLPELPILPF
ncbi:MAG TPA: hypothetical protein DCS24_07685 [Erythrobacter sp.]|nr:hypothetical protein [Erythrobacter sp.]